MSSTKIHVFYGVQYMANEQDLSNLKHVPDGAVVKLNSAWFNKDNGALMPLNKKDIPNQVKAQMLLLGEPI